MIVSYIFSILHDLAYIFTVVIFVDNWTQINEYQIMAGIIILFNMVLSTLF